MDVLIILVFVSIMVLSGGILFLFKGVRRGDYEHGDRLSLLPLEDDDPPALSAKSTPRAVAAAARGSGIERTKESTEETA